MRWLGLITLVLLSIAILAAPMLLLNPFKAETSTGLTIAFLIKRWGLLLDLLLIACAIALMWRRKVVLTIALIVMIAATVLARVNVFEKMFHPLPRPQYASIQNVNWVDADDMVMTVARGADAAAYPIRLLGYHHIVQDVVGDLPVVVTY
jgi:hypothetical protein